MINLRVTDNREDIRAWTGLPSDNHDEALWDAGFDLDDWDMCIESEVRLVDDDGNYQHDAWWLVSQMEAYCVGYNEVEYNGEIWIVPIDEAWWLVSQMEAYCVGYNEVEYNGKWYYTVHHA